MLSGHTGSSRRAGLCGLLLALATAHPRALAADPPKHYVFANYMVCYATYGQNLQGYEREIQEAQAAGIDGFSLDIGAWSGPYTYYKDRVKLIYDAADQLGSGFRLFPFIEFSDPNDILDLVRTCASRTPTLWYNGRLVLSAWGMNDVASAGWAGANWTNGTNGILSLLQTNGYPVFFIPHFWPDPLTELPSFSDAQYLLGKYKFLDGLFLFGAAGLPAQLAQCNSNYNSAAHAAGKVFMASVTPHYWGWVQPSNGRRYFETYGGEGIALQWNSIIANQPDWVNLVTWNDFNESTYVSPVEDPGQYFSQLVTPHRYSHRGYLELSKHYIAWYKTGQEPPWGSDAIYYFYRTHPMAAVAANTSEVPVTSRFGDVGDTIYTTVVLTAPAQLQVSSGGTVTTNNLGAGLTFVRTPFQPGPQSLALFRNGQQVISSQGRISSRRSSFTTSSPPAALSMVRSRPNPPGNLHKLGP